MSCTAVVGVANLETTVPIDGFPLPYEPVRYRPFGLHTTVGGVGFNVAKALSVLGDDVRLAGLIGPDIAGQIVQREVDGQGLKNFLLPLAAKTPQSVVLYDPQGGRQINTDLADLLDLAYPKDSFKYVLEGCDTAVITNVNFTRPLLEEVKRRGIRIVTDVHTIHDLEDDYNQDYMAAADVLFMSHERLPCAPEDWLARVMERYAPDVAVVSLGAEGALLATKDTGTHLVPAVKTRKVVNTVGAGDALLAAFVHFYSASYDALSALELAVVFASYKLGEAGASSGFLSEADLLRLAEDRGVVQRST